jgi:D-arabinose 1-dehydrogenase-like Zn-dependent alcohol dehydrogenase
MSLEFTVFKGSASGSIVEAKTRHHEPTANQVLIKITHSGICGTNEYCKGTDMVLGHEGVSTVEKIGESVSQFKIGDVVGWGFTHKTCGRCEQCEKAQDVGKMVNCLQRPESTWNLETASESFKGVVERLESSLRPFQGVLKRLIRCLRPRQASRKSW